MKRTDRHAIATVMACLLPLATQASGIDFDAAPGYREAINTTPADFTGTHLSFAGNTGGHAYAFGRPGFKYVVYAISGSNNMTNDGLLVLSDDEAKPVKHALCDAGTITDTDDSVLSYATLKWKIDPTIDAHGLPDVGK